MTVEIKSLETKLVDMLMDIHGREASLLHWAIKRKPDVMHAMYELWKKDVDPAEAPKYVRDPESWEAVIYENWKTGMGKIKLIKMLREMNGSDLRESKKMVEEWIIGWEAMSLTAISELTFPKGALFTAKYDGLGKSHKSMFSTPEEISEILKKIEEDK